MNPELEKLLDYLEARVDLKQQEKIQELYQKTLQWQPVERLPIIFTYPFPDDAPFIPYPHREIFDDPEKMLYNELVYAFQTSILCHAQIGDDLPYTIRANFGTVLIASMFGARIEQVEDNPPWVRPFESLEEFQQAIDNCDPMDFTQGWYPKVVETYQCYHRMFEDYPVLKQTIKIVLPDMQGPIDTAELLRGSAIFMDLYDHPRLVQQALTKIAMAQVGFARYLWPLITDGPEGFCHQHAMMLPGNMLLRNDSSIMVSARMYRKHIAPHDEFVMKELDGGIHACGKVEHIAQEYLKLPSIRSLDLGQPEMNDLDAIYANAKQREIPLIRLDVPEDELLSGHVRERFPTGITLKHHTPSIHEARRIMVAYHPELNEQFE